MDLKYYLMDYPEIKIIHIRHHYIMDMEQILFSVGEKKYTYWNSIYMKIEVGLIDPSNKEYDFLLFISKQIEKSQNYGSKILS